MPTIQPKILETPGAKLNGKKISGENISKIWVYLARLSPCLEILILENDFGWMESAHVLIALFALWLAEKSRVIFPIKIETSTKRDLITSFFPRLASDANLYFEISLVHFFFIS